MKILICGSRNYDNAALIYGFVRSLPDNAIIVEGEAKGADSLSREAAILYGLEVEKYPANWNLYGPQSGYLRNIQMLKEGKPDYIIAYSNDIKNSKGTKHMINQGIKNNVPTYLNVNKWEDIKNNLIKPITKLNNL